MMPQATGRLVRKDDGVYVVLDRMFKAPIDDVWSYFTRSPRLAEWIGEVKGTGSTGAVKFRMNAEGDGAVWENVTIMLCEAPHRLHVDIGKPPESLVLFVHLTEGSGHTTVTFGQRLRAPITTGPDYCVGWDYYLDRLVAAHDGKSLPVWDHYYPAMKDHYEVLCRELDHDLRVEHANALRDGTNG